MATPPASSSARSWNLQRDSDRCALSGLGLEREAPAVRFDDAARDRQPEAGSPPLRGHEEIEDVEPGLDARPRVGDAEHGGAVLDAARQLQRAPPCIASTAFRTRLISTCLSFSRSRRRRGIAVAGWSWNGARL